MSFKNYLLSLRWNTFAKYPAQGSDVYIHCFTDDGSTHKFVKVKQFNAICFDFRGIVSKYSRNHQWQFSWLSATKTEEDYDNSIAD